MELNGILDFNAQTGLVPHSKAEILDDLKNISKQAFGSDFSIQEGTEWYTFLDILSTSLSSASGSVQNLYSTLGVVNASGTILDNAVSLAGITRRSELKSSINIEMEINDVSDSEQSYQIPAGTIIKCVSNEDNKKVSYWKSKNTIYIERIVTVVSGETQYKKLVGNGIFYSFDNEDNYYISPFENSHFEFVDSVISSRVTFSKDENGKDIYTNITGHPQETDAELRYRYVEELYRPSSGTVEGLQAAILNSGIITYSKVLQNSDYDVGSDYNPYNLPKHSVWVIVDGTSTWRPEEFTISNYSFNDGSDTYTFNSSYTTVTVKGTEYSISNNQFYIEGILYLLDSYHTKVTKNPYSEDKNDLEIAKIIYNKKSIGCSTAIGYNTGSEPTISKNGQGGIVVRIEQNGVNNVVKFSRASSVGLKVSGNIIVGGLVESEALELAKGIISEAKNNIQNYISSLGIGNDVLYGGLVNSIYKIHIDNSYTDYVFDIESLSVNKIDESASNRIIVQPNEYASIKLEDINLTATYSVNGKQLISGGTV